MPKIVSKRLRVRRDKNSPWTDIPAAVVRRSWEEETDPTVPDWAKQPDKPKYTASEVGALPASTKIPAKTSDLQNDSGFITRLVSDLANYYTKNQTYSREEVDARVSAIPKFSISVVSSLPTSNISETTVYLVKAGSASGDMYTEYIRANGAWEILGSQRVDLTGYATEAWVNLQLADYLTADKLTAAIITDALGYVPADAKDVEELSEVKADKSEIPVVAKWALAELPFTDAHISNTESGSGFVVNPTNYKDGKTYFRYHAGETSFRWTNPNPQKGSLTITMRGYSQYSDTLSTKIVTVYTDGTDNSLTDMMYLTHGNTVTYTTDPDKTVDYIRGNYDFENWVLLDMDVLSIVADYPAPTGTVKTVNGVEPDENGNVEIDIPEGGGGSGGTGIALGISGATVGQIARITTVDDNGVPTAWESVDLPTGGNDRDWDIHYKINITEPLSEGFEISEVEGESLKLREMWAMVKLQNGSDASQWMGCTVTTDNSGSDARLSSPDAGHGGKDTAARAYAYFVYHAMVLGNGRAVCEIMASAASQGTQILKTNGAWLNNWLDYNRVKYISGIKCTNNLGKGTPQGYGTEIEIWGKRV